MYICEEGTENLHWIMKALFLLFAALLCVSGPARGEGPTNNSVVVPAVEVNHGTNPEGLEGGLAATPTKSRWAMEVGLGLGSLHSLIWSVYTPDVVPGGTVSWDNFSSPLDVNISIFYKIKKWFEPYIHLALGFGYLECTDRNDKVLGTMFRTPIALSAGVRFNYFTAPRVRIYGDYGVARAYLLIPYSYRPIHPMTIDDRGAEFDFYPLCFDFGRRNAISLKGGIGSQGLVSASYRIEF